METDNSEDIESLIENMKYIPGHFHLDLNLNCDPVGPVNLRLRDTYLKQESLQAELEVEVGYLQYAVRNLLGLLAFHLEQLDRAEEIFRYKTLTSSGRQGVIRKLIQKDIFRHSLDGHDFGSLR